jgi:NAD(P)-dependent dehydrogenase (short-subunit alcohol dehydrogenase family)
MTAESPAGVLVTGAGGGIGRACVDELNKRGLRVVAGLRHDDDVERMRSKTAADVTPVLLDVTDPEQVSAAARRVEDVVGPTGLRGVVNNAGWMLSGPLEHVAVAEVRRLFEVNVLGPLTVVQAFLPLLRASGGRVVNIGSTSGRVAGRFVGPYAASKAALDSLTKTLRLEMATSGVGVSIVEPGVVATSLWDQELGAQDEWVAALSPEASQRYGAWATRRRAKLAELRSRGVEPSEVAAAVAEALLSPQPRPRYIVGRDAQLRSAVTRLPPERALIRLAGS